MFYTIKKLSLTFIVFNLLMLQSLVADMLFYYSSAVLPSIISSQQKKAMYPGFENLNLQVGNYYDYEFLITGTTNGSTDTPESGVMKMELTDTYVHNFGDPIGEVTFYRTIFSGDEPSIGGFPNCYYIATKNGVIYIVRYMTVDDTSGYYIVPLFDSNTGYIYQSGFWGYFSSTREEFIFMGRIENDFINAEAVVVSEPLNIPDCSQVDGVQPCGDEQSHNYIVKEYYIPNIGFGGFYRSGGSVYTGGGYTDTFTSNFQLGLIYTNAFDVSTLP